MSKTFFYTLSLSTFFLSTYFTGCASVQTHVSGRNAIEQYLTTKSIDRAVKKLHIPGMEGKKVFVDVSSLAEKDYIKSAVSAHLIKNGTSVVTKSEDAQFVVKILTNSAGTDMNISRYGIPLISPIPGVPSIGDLSFYESKTQKGFTRLRVYLYKRVSSEFVLSTEPLIGRSFYRYFKLFSIIGPFTKTDLDKN